MKHFVQQAEISKYTSLLELLNNISTASSYEKVISILKSKVKWVIDFQKLFIIFVNSESNLITVKTSFGIEGEFGEEDLQHSAILNYLISNKHDLTNLSEKTIYTLVEQNEFDKLWKEMKGVFASKISISNKENAIIIFGTDLKSGFLKNEMLQLNIISNIVQSNFSRIQSSLELFEKNRELENSLQKVKTIQKTIILQERLASLGAVTAGIAHELKNPLHLILNYTRVIQEQIEEIREDQKNREPDTTLSIQLSDIDSFTEVITKHSTIANQIINSMINQHSAEGKGSEQVNISELIHGSLQISYHAMRARNRVEVEIVEDVEKEIISFVNKENLNLAMINLFDNAFYTLHKRSLSEGKSFHAKILVKVTKVKGNLSISIRDNGFGIDKSIIETVFNPFFTTKDPGEGMGLGLSFVYDVINNHDGTIDINSIKNDYTKIDIFLPIKSIKAAA
ncbi:hypothetical protein A9Q84_19000 [Halobacteriovorax marinus]|uniref:histidine kinase n=1 Tax=Halobacteriovorax marinus TaxID=97084 RepID=A0A1Y5F7N5_9BACT|nr:hypothetical protein A9Q84_19000 [Halobacteriovorax marinus]